MKRALLLAPVLAACGPEIGLYGQSEPYDTAIEIIELIPCENELNEGVIPYDRVDPSSFPLDVSFIDEKAVFFDVFSGYRDQIRAVFAVPLVGGGFDVHPVELEKSVDELEFSSSPVGFETGDFQVGVDLGAYVSIDGGDGFMLITNSDCSSVYGYASYEFFGLSPDFTSTMMSYMDENGDIVEH